MSETTHSIESYGETLKTLLLEHLKQRQPIVKRWTEDMHQYRNRYEKNIETGRSKVFVGYTRSKTDSWVAQMTDMLFPSDDKNYGISPTPVPQIANLAKQPDSQDPMQMEQINTARQIMQAAKERAEAMEQLIDDQLAECDYSAIARLCLHYAAVLGTGIIRAPVAELANSRKWVESETGEWSSNQKSVLIPTARLVLPWDFVPDMTASTLKDCQFVFERSFLTKKQLKGLTNNPHYLKNEVEKLLEVESQETHTTSNDLDGYVDTLRSLSGLEKITNDKRYEVWTYHGEIPINVFDAVNQQIDDEYKVEISDELREKGGEISGVIVMAGNGTILSANLNPFETDDFPYSVYVCEPDVACLFGFGIPYLCRDSQEILNTGWRAMIDNGVTTIGSQIVVNNSVLSPVDGNWDITPNKVWRTNDRATASAQFEANRAFGVFHFESRQQEFANIIQLAKSFMDEESGLPMIAQGEQGQVTPTLGGMSMLMNAANAVRRRQVKEWDDQVTKPLIRKFYEYNMLMSEDPNIKGDMQIVARGTSALLVKETQTAQIIDIFQKFGQHPQLMHAFDWYDGAKTLMQSMSMGARTMLIPREEYEQKLQEMQQAAAEQPQDPELMKAQMQMELAKQKQQHELQFEQMKMQHELQIEQMKVQIKEKELEMKQLEIESRSQYQQQQINLMQMLEQAKLAAQLQMHTGDNVLNAEKFRAEIALKNDGAINPSANDGLD